MKPTEKVIGRFSVDVELANYSDLVMAEKGHLDPSKIRRKVITGVGAIVEPRRQTALIGAIVLEDLDFLVDPKKARLVPRDPDGVVCEIE